MSLLFISVKRSYILACDAAPNLRVFGPCFCAPSIMSREMSFDAAFLQGPVCTRPATSTQEHPLVPAHFSAVALAAAAGSLWDALKLQASVATSRSIAKTGFACLLGTQSSSILTTSATALSTPGI